MTARDRLADCITLGDSDGALKIFDDLESHRQQLMAREAAYLQEIRNLKINSAPGNKIGVKGVVDSAGFNKWMTALEKASTVRRRMLEALERVPAGEDAL